MIAGLWYYGFTGAFVLYQLDVFVYSFIALLARIFHVIRPVPGHPWYRIWHKDKYVDLPECDLDGFRLVSDSPTASAAAAAAAAAAEAKNRHTNTRPSIDSQAPQPFLRHGWHIATVNAMSNSSVGGASSHTTAGSSSAHSLATTSISNGSDFNSLASGSQSSTPMAPRGVQLTAPLDTIFSMDLDDSITQVQQLQQPGHQHQLPQPWMQQQGHAQGHGQQQPQEVVCHLQSQASLPAVPHVTSSTLRYRAVGSEDGSNTPSGGFPSGSSNSPSSSRQLPQLHTRYNSGAPSSGTNSLQGSPKKQRAAWDSPGGSPPPSSALFEPDRQRMLLPASLVQQYGYFPLVLVQLPMYNEEAHCEVVIERACNMLWPRHRVIIQVCDDSTREDVRRRIDAKVSELLDRGHRCLVTRRDVNKGFKAGNMLNGMAHVSKLPWEYVAIFDADFEMPPDWLFQTIWHLERDKQLAFVQTRWTFTNGYDNLLCWLQQVALSFHFAVEQRARSFLRTFFGFNGTAGVWRRSAMEQAGGWNMDSTVEDMDLSLRAYLNGWKFRYLHWVACPNELPPTMSAYKTQQYRWNSGPMVVIKGLIRRIWTTDRVGLMDRLSCTYFFFRFIYSAFLTVICLLCPAVIIWLDPWTWGLWGPEMMFLVAGNTAAAAFVWFAGLLFWPYFLLQCGVGYFRVYAMINGLLGSKKSGTWKVTAKFGKQKGSGRLRLPKHKPYLLELVLAAGFFTYTFFSVWNEVYLLAAFTWVVAWTLVVLSFGDYLF